MKTFIGMALALALASVCGAQVPPATRPLLEVARSADGFVESIGINGSGGPYVTPLPPDGKPYTPEQAKLYDTVPVDPQYLMGVRYSRIEGGRFPAKPFIRLYDDYGIRIDNLTRWSFRDLREPDNLAKCLEVLHSFPPDMIASIEGDNEANFWRMSGMKDYPATVAKAKANQEALYTAVKNDAALRKIPVLCFSVISVEIGQGSERQYAGQTTNAFDFEVTHSYEFDSSHFQVPLADTALGAIDYCGKVSDRVVSPGSPLRPIVSTESGCTSNTPVAQATQTRMDPIILASNFTAGIPRTYLYGSWGNKPWDICAHPAGEAITQITGLLGEAAWDRATHTWKYPQFQPGTLRYAIAAPPQDSPDHPVNVKHLLLQKSNGIFYLLLWNDVPIWNHQNDSLFNFPPVRVTIGCGAAAELTSVTVYDIQANGQFAKSVPTFAAAADNAQTITVDVADHLTIIELVPTGGLEATQAPLATFTQLATAQTVDDNAINAQGLTTVNVEKLTPVTAYKVRLTFADAAPGVGGKAVDLLLQGNKVARDVAVSSAKPLEYFATTDWNGRLFVQMMDVPGAARVLAKVELFEPGLSLRE